MKKMNVPQLKPHDCVTVVFGVTQSTDIYPFYEKLLARELTLLHEALYDQYREVTIEKENPLLDRTPGAQHTHRISL